MKSTNNAIKLDWTKLFGFKQVKAAQNRNQTDSGFVLIGSKIGGKGAPPPVEE